MDLSDSVLWIEMKNTLNLGSEWSILSIRKVLISPFLYEKGLIIDALIEILAAFNWDIDSRKPSYLLNEVLGICRDSSV